MKSFDINDFGKRMNPPVEWNPTVVSRMTIMVPDPASQWVNPEEPRFKRFHMAVDGRPFEPADYTQAMLSGHLKALYNWIASE